MPTPSLLTRFFAALALALSTASALADPQLTSWFTGNSGQYARIYQSTADETLATRVKSATWSRGSGTQSSPVYADVNEIAYSAGWVYIKTSGLASHMMGPWYLDAAKTTNFPNFPSNTASTYRIPRVPAIPAVKTLTGLGATGRMVNGVSMFDSRDAFSYRNASATDATPTNGLTGDGIWNRDGYHNEGVTFDPALAHQAGNNYHYHAHPIGLRFQLGDHVDYNAGTNRYTESAAAVTQHSPIVAWAADGLPVYGPYGYSDPTNAGTALRRMVSGFTLRDGTNGTTAITVRQVLPLWAQRVQSRTTLTAAQYGPVVNATYLLGHYIEDFDYRGDLGQTLGVDFDLNEQNVRFCVTPEFPAGTWAYFTPINADGTPQYPYTTGRAYYGTPSGGATTIAETVTTQFLGGANTALAVPTTPTVSSGTVTIAWSSVEGGTYSVDASPTQATWTNKVASVVASGVATASSYTAIGTTGTEYGRVNRTALATYDATGQTAATVAQNTIKSYSLTANTPPTITAISAQSIAMNTATGALAVTVGDAETALASLTMVGSSSNTTLVPNANITFGGANASRTVTVTPAASRTGTATITVGVNDGTVTTSTTFLLTVTGTNTAPTVSAISAQSTLQNTATSAIPFTVGDVDTGAASVALSSSSANTTLVPNANIVCGGSGANRTVTITPVAGQTGSAVITITAFDGAAITNSAFTLTVVSANPTITSIINTPSSPTSGDPVVVRATVGATAGRTISTVQMTYNVGGGATTVFNETMGTAANTAWAGTGTVYPWTITFAGPPASPFAQSQASNHTPVGQGNQYGMEITANAPPIANATMTTTNVINATGTAGTVSFWIASSGLVSPQGWDFQTSTDGTTYTTRSSELTGANHAYQQFSYTLSAAERSSTLRLRFRFAGPGMSNVPKVYLDDITVVVGGASSPVTVNMLDNGANGDGAAGDGVYGYSAIPAQSAGTTVSYTITATDNTAAATTTGTNAYTVVAAAPVLAVTPATGLVSSGTVGGAFTPSGATYTLSNTGNASLNWTAAKTAAWVTLSSASGTLAAGANTTVTASINATASTLAVGSYSDTITFTNSTNANGNTTRAVSLAVGSNTAPSAPALTALPLYSQGGSKTVSWPAVSGATSYTIQIATDAAFTTSVVSQTVAGASAAFTNLVSGVTYYYRVLATNGIGSSANSNVVSSTQDGVAPLVAITSPASPLSTATTSVTVSGTSSDALSGISNVTVNGVTATTANGFANWTVSVPLGYGTNGITAVAYDGAGNVTTTAPVRVTLTTAQTYNPLIIPEVMTGTTFNLDLHNTTKRFGNSAFQNTADSTTISYNNMLMWGPTLIMNKGDWVQINLTNNLSETTTTHWHGFHIPAIMDGGPHQTIPAGTTWRPSFKVDNNAATYWYHPHLHEHTQDHLTKGGGGMIIIRDPAESALNLPRTYGVDDIPLALTSRRWASNQFVTGLAGVTNSVYGDYMVVNGTVSPQITLPKQYVRLRILNAEIERSYNLGITTSAGADRTFYVIATDGGLVNAPIPVTRVALAIGERVEILVDLTGDTVGASFDLKAYNSGQANDFPGGEPGTTGQFGSLLNATTFNILHVNVGAATANPVTTRPTTLTTNTFYTDANVTNNRTVNITGGFPNTSTPTFTFDNLAFSTNVINQTLNLNAVEKWSITNASGFSHSYHIHDIQFHLTSRTGGNNAGIKAYEEGWKDTLFVGQNQTVTFIAKFDGFASDTNPFMYHCHFSNHEDEGLMGQFVVRNNATEALAVSSFTRYGDSSLIQLDFKSTPGTTYSLQYLTDLTTGTWTDIGSVTSDGASASFTETDAARLGQARGFYRVTIPKIP